MELCPPALYFRINLSRTAASATQAQQKDQALTQFDGGTYRIARAAGGHFGEKVPLGMFHLERRLVVAKPVDP